MEDEDGGCEGRQEKGRRGWRQRVRRVDLACKDVRTYVCILTRYMYLHVHVYINAWLCIVRGLSVRPLTIEHNSGVAVDASHHVTNLHPVRLVGVKVTVTTLTGVPDTHSERGHASHHTLTTAIPHP